MLHSESIVKIAPALVKASKALTPAIQDAVNPHFKSHYATLGAVLEAVRAAFLPNDLCLVQSCEQSDDAGVCVTTTVLHTSGEWIACVIRIPLDKPSAIGVGSAISYGRRYGAGAVAGLWSESDDDGTAASQYERPATTTTKPNGQPPKASGNPVFVAAFAAKAMPFGKFKGVALGDLDADELRRTASWCRQKDVEKFKDLIVACESVASSKELSEMTVPGDAEEDDGRPY